MYYPYIDTLYKYYCKKASIYNICACICMYNGKYVQFINKKKPLYFNCAIKICHCGRRGSLPVLSTVFAATVNSLALH